MKRLIIVGAGGMGRSVYSMATGSLGYGYDFVVKGFIDDDVHALDKFDNYPPILSSIDDYTISDEDVFICSFGDTKTKKMICERLISKGAKFYTIIHKTATIRQNAKIGDGVIIAEYAAVGADSTIGNNTLIQPYATVAHDCKVGNYVRIDTRATLVGGVIVEDAATIHTAAMLNHKVTVGECATVAACSFVIKKVKPNTTVFGVPAKTLDF